ncbi:MAG: hypothetical protein ABL903_16830 [Methylococcales bacterium]
MKLQTIKLGVIAFFALSTAGCIQNPTPNAGSFSMTDAQTKAAQYNVLQTQNADREARKGILRDEAEVRAWESNISRPNNIIIVPRR